MSIQTKPIFIIFLLICVFSSKCFSDQMSIKDIPENAVRGWKSVVAEKSPNSRVLQETFVPTNECYENASQFYTNRIEDFGSNENTPTLDEVINSFLSGGGHNKLSYQNVEVLVKTEYGAILESELYLFGKKHRHMMIQISVVDQYQQINSYSASTRELYETNRSDWLLRFKEGFSIVDEASINGEVA